MLTIWRSLDLVSVLLDFKNAVETNPVREEMLRGLVRVS